MVGGVGVSPPPFIFQPPSLFSKITLGGQAKPSRAAFNRSMSLALCLHQKISNTCELQDHPMLSQSCGLFTYLLQSMSHMPMFYFCTSMPYTPLCICVCTVGHARSKGKRGRMLYRVAQNKWDLLLKLYMGYFLTIKINCNGIKVSVCVFSMVKPVQCLLNMDRKLKLSISVIVST